MCCCVWGARARGFISDSRGAGEGEDAGEWAVNDIAWEQNRLLVVAYNTARGILEVVRSDVPSDVQALAGLEVRAEAVARFEHVRVRQGNLKYGAACLAPS